MRSTLKKMVKALVQTTGGVRDVMIRLPVSASDATVGNKIQEILEPLR